MMNHPLIKGQDALVVGAGPNGLAAAIGLAASGRRVVVREAKETIGGGSRSMELTLPGFVHDVCSAVHPLGIASPFFRNLDLNQYGLQWVHPPAALAHPLDNGKAVLLYRSLEDSVRELGPAGVEYARLMQPLVNQYDKILYEFLGPLRFPRYPFALAQFGLPALLPAHNLARLTLGSVELQATFSGIAAHSMLPIDRIATAAFGLMLAMLIHSVGWPFALGGSQKIVDAMASHLISQGGRIETGCPVDSLMEASQYGICMLDITPRQILSLDDGLLPQDYKEQLDRYRYGPGVYKLDLAMDAPIPWRAKQCLQAGTVHLGGTMEEIMATERAVWNGVDNQFPFVILAQPSLFDPTRAPEGKHVVWAYCHVPHGSEKDMKEPILDQIERFAPGVRNRIIAAKGMNSVEMNAYNANYIGGDINGGIQDLGQLFTRPVPRLNPYRMPVKGMYICSSSTPPGGGVHGMCGYWAARTALKNEKNGIS